MREILFRGFSSGEVFYGHLFTEMLPSGVLYAAIVNEIDGNYRNVVVDEKTVGQFTGLTDCNGVKIFEGDIVVITEDDEDSCCGNAFKHEPVVIIWKRLQWMFDNKVCKVLGERDWTDYADLSGMSAKCEFEVIGNIHQNPELLERNHA